MSSVPPEQHSQRSKIAESIGWITIAYAWLERSVEMVIWTLLDLTYDDGQSVTTHLSTPARLDILETLAHSKISNPERRKHLLKLTKQIRKDLALRRNKYIHSLVTLGKPHKPIVLQRVVARGSLRRTAEIVSLNDLVQLTNDIIAVGDVLTEEFIGPQFD
jgi:hypothetical protein